jgi:hypothetical protein
MAEGYNDSQVLRYVADHPTAIKRRDGESGRPASFYGDDSFAYQHGVTPALHALYLAGAVRVNDSGYVEITDTGTQLLTKASYGNEVSGDE